MPLDPAGVAKVVVLTEEGFSQRYVDGMLRVSRITVRETV